MLEEKVGHPLGRLVCLLHANELPFRKLFEIIDGKSTGPSSFSGTIGSMVEKDLTEMPVVNCRRIRG